MRGMTSPCTTDRRFEDLEVKTTFLEDAVEQLNQVIVRQQRQIDLLTAALGQLREQVELGGPAASVRSLRDELPPHY